MDTEYTLLHDPEASARCDTWFCKIPIIGWQIGGMRQFANERKLVQQAVERGPIPESEWEKHQYSRDIRKKLEKIVIDHAFPKKSTFHPLDPFELMMVLRYGDLNEIEIMMAIEDEFGVKMGEELIDWIVKERITFIDFIHFLEKAAQRGDAPDTSGAGDL